MPKKMDHAAYQRGLRSKTEAELRFIAKDANEAATVNPQGENAGYYADEVHYALAELKRRQGRNHEAQIDPAHNPVGRHRVRRTARILPQGVHN